MSENPIDMPESSIKSTHSSNSSSGPYNLHGNALTLTVLGIVVFILALLSFHYKHRLQRGRGQARLQFAVAENSGGDRTAASPSCKGLDDSTLQALPLFSFDPQWAQREGGFGGGGNGSGAEWQCAVCLSLLEGGDEVRLLPRCTHAFHAACIDLWFRSHSDCPLCRQRVCDSNDDGDNSRKNATDAAEAVAVRIGELGDSASTTTANNNAATATVTVTTVPRSCLKVAIFEVDHGS